MSMFIEINKKEGSGGWAYPDQIKYFSEAFTHPSEPDVLVVRNLSGKNTELLSSLSGLSVVEYTGVLPRHLNPPLILDIVLSTDQCLLGEVVDYTVTFGQQVTLPSVVPISVSDRNGNHVTNIGCTVVDGFASGSFVMPFAGDFTVTEEAINFHSKLINAPLKITDQPWLRVYQ